MKIGILLLSLLFAGTVHAGYLTIGESAEVVAPKNYRIGGDLQMITSEGGGMNIDAFLDTGWADGMSSRFSFGVGKVDFHLGASFKYIPIPDVARQPAIGFKASFFTARFESENINVIQLAPLVSKKMDSEIGLWTPYAAVAINMGLNSGAKTGTQFVLGSELALEQYESMHLAAELAMNLKDSMSHIAAFVSIPFDSQHGFKKRK